MMLLLSKRFTRLSSYRQSIVLIISYHFAQRIFSLFKMFKMIMQRKFRNKSSTILHSQKLHHILGLFIGIPVPHICSLQNRPLVRRLDRPTLSYSHFVKLNKICIKLIEISWEYIRTDYLKKISLYRSSVTYFGSYIFSHNLISHTEN